MPATSAVSPIPSPTREPAHRDPRTAERAVVLGYVPLDRRAGFAALLALDDVLARIVRTTREPIVGQMRLTWWYEALAALDDGRPPVGEPVLAALAEQAVPHGVSGGALAVMIDAWEILLTPDPLDPAILRTFSAARGSTLFAALAALLGGHVDVAVSQAGEGWALADLAGHWREPAQAGLARTMAVERLEQAFRQTWPGRLRPLGMLALLARADLAPSPRPGSPRRLARLLMHRIWGR